MSWARLDDELPESAKWASLSDTAFRFAIRVLCWARKPKQLRKRPGFIPTAMAADLARKPAATAAKLAKELVNAGKPLHDEGILIVVDGGWLIHDFDQYGSKDDGAAGSGGAPTSIRSAAASLAGKASAAARNSKNGTAQPVRSSNDCRTETSNESNESSNVAPNEPSNDSRTPPNESFERSPNVGRSSSQDLSQDPQILDPEPTKDLGGSTDLVSSRAIRDLAERWIRNRGAVELEHGDCTTWPEVKAVCAAFAMTWHDDDPRNGADDRARVIMARFAEGFTVDQLVDAIQRTKFADYMEKASNQRIESVLKSASRVDNFRRLTALPRKAGEREPKQPNAKTAGVFKAREE